MIDIGNEVLTKLKTDIADVRFLSPYQTTSKKFPCATFEEKINTTHQDTVDTSGEFASNAMFEINIYTTGQGKETSAKKIRDKVDNIMSGFYRMSRITSEPAPNYADENIYRYFLQYECVVTKNKQIYRR